MQATESAAQVNLRLRQITSFDNAFKLELEELLPHLRLEAPLDDDDDRLIPIVLLAFRLGVTYEELSLYLHLQAYVKACRTDEYPLITEEAERVGLPADLLGEYVALRLGYFNHILAVD